MERKGENNSRKQPTVISCSEYPHDKSSRFITSQKRFAIVEDQDFNSWTVYKEIVTEKDVEKSIQQSSIRKLILIKGKEVIEIELDGIKLLKKNQHPNITLQPHSVNYLKKVVLKYGGN